VRYKLLHRYLPEKEKLKEGYSLFRSGKKEKKSKKGGEGGRRGRLCEEVESSKEIGKAKKKELGQGGSLNNPKRGERVRETTY